MGFELDDRMNYYCLYFERYFVWLKSEVSNKSPGKGRELNFVASLLVINGNIMGRQYWKSGIR